MKSTEPAYPRYSAPERVADAVMHILGISGALVGSLWLIIWTFGRVDGEQTVALSLYGCTLVAGFVASGIYHFTPWESLRPAFRRADHAAIYLKIAGTYAPLVLMIGTLGSYLVLIAVWTLALLGVVRKLWFWQDPSRNGIALYLAMGWLSVLLVGSVLSTLPLATALLMGAGGLLYTAGVGFHVLENMKFSNAIWHGFVLSASACFFAAIAFGLAAPTS